MKDVVQQSARGQPGRPRSSPGGKWGDVHAVPADFGVLSSNSLVWWLVHGHNDQPGRDRGGKVAAWTTPPAAGDAGAGASGIRFSR